MEGLGWEQQQVGKEQQQLGKGQQDLLQLLVGLGAMGGMVCRS
jgi:hypothetical protein